jgi:hypothetical protein
VLLALAAAVACGGSGSTAPPIIIVSGGVTSFTVTTSTGQHTASTLLGQTVQLHGTAYDGNLDVVTGTWVVQWSSGDTTIATVDATGLVHTVSAGSTYVFGSIHPDSANTFKDSTLVIVLTPT